MRPRPLTWLLVSVVSFAGAYYFWRLGDRLAARRTAPPAADRATRTTQHPSRGAPLSPFQFLTQAGTLNSPPAAEPLTNNAAHATNRFALRLSNTSATLRQLQRSDQAILLENALLDTAQAVPSIPEHLRAQGDPGAYLVQSRGAIDRAFRTVLQQAGATIVSYIPNNAYLVRASAAVAQQLQAGPRVQAVLAYEPYYKLKLSLLKLAVAQEPLPEKSALNVLLFADARETTRAELEKLGASIVGDEETSPFGPVVRVIPPADGLAAVAGLPGVQEVEWALPRAPANDFSRARIGVATDFAATNNYLGLSGSNVLVNINDSGVDATHPDLAPRVSADSTNTLVDPNGHGTHVAGIIAGSGGQSSTVTNASGPDGPYSGTNNQFRGMAPAASLFALPVGIMTGPLAGSVLFGPSDGYLQQTAARTNALISNNGWNYVGPDSQTYDLHAASYDAAVRDALPTVSGSRPLLYVFSAGNAGGAGEDGVGGVPDTIQSPGTAKNVITVGAIEQLRNITNKVWKCTLVNATNSCNTNQPWLKKTDANDQVADFSSRGPVGLGIEGDSGRFKPDLVAPGTFVISTKSHQWDTNAYYNPTSHQYFLYRDIFVGTNLLYLDSIFIPANAVQFNLTVLPNTNSPIPFPDLPMYVNPTLYPTNTDPVIGTNRVSVPPDLPLSVVGTYWYFGIGNRTADTVVCDLLTDIVVTNDQGNYLQVLAGMNDSLGPYYRYESGTSMAAADVSGTLALMQEFFEQRLQRTNSPALMKALLINGARSVGTLYDFNVGARVNSQGWGLINLPTTLPGSLTNLTPTNAMVIIDQSPANALATSQSRTYKVSLSPFGRRQPLRATLVWTDPPGNPIASVKLVNDLDLVVTNLDNTNFVYFGNDIGSGSDFNQAWNTNTLPNVDTVNNVENVFLDPSRGINSQLSTNYSITVVGRRVNVNAVTAQTNNVCQDYALVISSGDGLVTNGVGVDLSSSIVSSDEPLVTVITNSFVNSPDFVGGILFNQRAGANPQLLGTNTLALTNNADAVLTVGVTNQWHFYVITNDTGFTNAAFLTFLPVNLAVPRMGVFEPHKDLATRPESDIDLYVAPPSIPNHFALTNLDPAVLDQAGKSLKRGGTETIVYSNAIIGTYYLGVKSEDQQAAEYALLAVFSRNPFGNSDSNGVHLIGIPLMQPIEDGSPQLPGVATIVAPNISSIQVRRVIVTNVVNHELISDLIGSLSHGSDYAVLNNHTCVIDPNTTACQTWTSFIYDDSDERNVGPDPFLTNPRVQHTDGPGSLGIFSGKEGEGQWMLSMVDNATNHIGTNVSLGILLEPQPDLTGAGITVTIQGGACRNDFIDVPPNATSLSVTVAVVSATGPIDYTIEVCPLGGGACKSTEVTNALGGSVTIDQTDTPPLQVNATYRIRVCNLTQMPITVNIRAAFEFSLNTLMPVLSASTPTAVPILDDAVTDIFITNDFHNIVSSVDVGLLIRDPRISDLAITLISPKGTRVLLFENRGAGSTNGLGTFSLATNFVMETFFTNNFDLAPVGLYAPGAVFQGWNVLSNYVDVLDDYTCLCLSNHILALFDGAVSNSLPTTNSLVASNSVPYTLSYRVNHLPWLEGMVTWWPLDIDGSDIFSGLDGLLLGDVLFPTGKVYRAYMGDGVATRMIVPGCPELDLGRGRGFSIEGWIKPANLGPRSTFLDPSVIAGPIANPANGHGYYLLAPMYWPEAEAKAVALGGHLVTINDAAENAWVYSTFANYGGTPRFLFIGFTDQGHEGQWVWTSGEPVTYTQWDAGEPNNGMGIYPYENYSIMYGPSGRAPRFWNDCMGVSYPGIDQLYFGVVEVKPLPPAGPLVEWYDSAPPTNQSPLGVQFWLGLTNGSGSLDAIIWDTNSVPHVITTLPQVITNFGWQHVGLTYDTNSNTAVLYTNGQSAATVQFPTAFVPRTSGDVYLGFDPTIIPTPISYPNFSSTAGLNLVGSAVQIGSVLRLSSTVEGQIGNAWAQDKQPCASGFDTRFQFRISDLGSRPGTPLGADGILFTVQNVSPTDPTWHPPPPPADGYVSVFYNTFLNWPGCTDYTQCDVSDNSVGIVSNGLYIAQVNLYPLGINLSDGNVHLSRIAFNGTGLSVWLDGVMLFTNVPIPGMAPAVDAAGYAWVGLGAAGGWAWENHDILSWTFGGPTPGTSFGGGLDEFSLYQRALSPCEVKAIYNAGSRGKYGTNVLVCPVVTEVTLSNTPAGIEVFTFTNGLAWVTNGPHWETNTIAFSTSTNPTPIVIRGLNPYDPGDTNAANNLNAVVDDFVLSQLVPQDVDGLLHFTENTNLATIPIKFAPSPFEATNFPPILVFTNDVRYATAGVYQAGATIQGDTNGPGIGLRDWTVFAGPVTVVSNAFLNPVTTNWLAMATGAVQCVLPTSPGHRYRLSYNLRGPCAVGWWNGSLDPLSQRAQDLISGNNGAFFYGATNTTAGFAGDTSRTYVGSGGLFFSGQTDLPPELVPDLWPEDTGNPASKIELADPPQLRFTNAFTIEGWIKPVLPVTNETFCGTEQIFFRGYPEPFDCRGLGDPYWLALEPALDGNPLHRELHFHIADAHTNTLGADVSTTNGPIRFEAGSNGDWWHIAAVFDKPFTNVTAVVNRTNIVTLTTNALRLYVNGVCVATNYTTISPYGDLDPSLSPGAAIGNRCRYDGTEPFYGFMDELTVYARALTEPEIAAIAVARTAGKADPSVPIARSLAKLSVAVNGAQLGVGYGDNSQWSTHSVEFTALTTNSVVTLQSLLPGTLLEGVTLTELPPELYYLPEVSLTGLTGEDAYGIWTLEIWDNRASPTNVDAQLIRWDLNLGFAPSNPPPVITLSHGIAYTNSLPAYGIQYFVVPAPQWALWATNTLQFANQVNTSNPLPVTVLFNQTNFPTPADFPLVGPMVSAGFTTLATNGTPPLVPGQSYYLALTNPNPVGVTFALGVWFDITTLNNCQVLVSNIVGVAGVPRYFQFDVPAYATPPGLPPQAVSFWLSGPDCNLKVVLSEHLPLPDLNHFDYTSQQPCTNDQIIMLVTNTTPFPIQTNRWYAGVFNTGPTNSYFAIQACYATDYPVIIPLTNGIPFIVPFTNSLFAAPPGPPQQFFFDLLVSNSVPGILFELYNLTGDADLVLQQAVPPTMTPYFAGSFFPGSTPEQIVLRANPAVPSRATVPDLRGHWYLGVYNTEDVNVAYTIRASLPDTDGLLPSGQPLRIALTPLALPRGLVLSWNSVVGERYIVQYTAGIAAPVIWTNLGTITATTTLTTFEITPAPPPGFFRVVQVYVFQPILRAQLVPGNQVRISWSTAFPGYTLQSKLGLFGTWSSVTFPPATGVFTIGNEFVVYDPLGSGPKYYRLIK